MTIAFRPHHFLCAFCFEGRGYSPAFIANFTSIMKVLNAPDGDQTEIKIVPHTDSICAPCPHRQGLGCETQEKISLLDANHATALNFHPGETITWQEAKTNIHSLPIEKFHEICATCEWKALGICEDKITKIV